MSKLSELLSRIEASEFYFRFQKMENKKKKFSIGTIAVLSLFFPVLFSGYIKTILIFILIYSLVGIGIYLLIGHAGIISLGQVGFYCIGAYTSALLSIHLGLSPWIGLCCAAAINGGIAYILGRPFLEETRGGMPLALAIITLAFSVVIYLVVTRLPFTGGHDGIAGIPPFSIGGVKFGDDQCYYLLWAIVGLALLFTYNLTDLKIGRGLRSLNEFAGGNEVAAFTSGLDVSKLRIQAFVISAVCASIAGSIYAHWLRCVVPESFNVVVNLIFVMMVGIGGFRSLWGALVGSAFYFGLKEVLSLFMGKQALLGWESIIFSLIFIIILIFVPGGITSLPDKWREWTHRREEVVSKREYFD